MSSPKTKREGLREPKFEARGQQATHAIQTASSQPAGNQAYLGVQQPVGTIKSALTPNSSAKGPAVTAAVAKPSNSWTEPPQSGGLQLIPMDQTVRLLEPISVGELTEELYGDSSLWKLRLFPVNRWMLEGAAVDTQLQTGSILRIIPELLVEPQRSIVLSVLRLQSGAREDRRVPYIEAIPDTAVVPGNAVRYEVNWPWNWFMGKDSETRMQWWAESDKQAVARFPLIPARVDGPAGLIDEARTFTVTMGAPGRHLIHCRLMPPTGEGHELTHEQYVVTLPEKTNIAAARHPEVPTLRSLIAAKQETYSERRNLMSKGERETFEERLRKLDELEATSKDTELAALISAERETYSEDWDLMPKEERETLERRLGELDKLATAAKDTDVVAVQAIYVSSSEVPVTIPLRIFMGYDPDKKNKMNDTFYLKLWDFTTGNGQWTQTAEGEHLDPTVRMLLRQFADDAPYPNGSISFKVKQSELRGHGSLLAYSAKLGAQSLTYPTDGGTAGAAVLRGLGFAALAVGGVAGLAGQAEVAMPALWVSGIFAAAGATVSLTERLEHGQFEWDVETGMDLLDIAGALVSFGLSSKVTATIRGLGTVTITGELVASGIGKIQLGIMGSQHLVRIGTAVDGHDANQVAAALRAALSDGALLLIMHRATRRPQSAQKSSPGPSELPKDELFGPRGSYIGEPPIEQSAKGGAASNDRPRDELFGPRDSYIGEQPIESEKGGPPASKDVVEQMFGSRGSYLGSDKLPNEPPPGRFVRQLTDTERERAQRLQSRSLGQPGAGPGEVLRWRTAPVKPGADFTGRGENGEQITVRSTPANPLGIIIRMVVPNVTELPIQKRDDVLGRAMKALGMGWDDWSRQSGHVHPLEAGGIEMPYNREPMTRAYNTRNRRPAEIRLREFIKANTGNNLSLEITRLPDAATTSRTTMETFIVRDASGKAVFEISVTDRGTLSGPDAPLARKKRR